MKIFKKKDFETYSLFLILAILTVVAVIFFRLVLFAPTGLQLIEKAALW